jgi:hypothetical protein
MALRGAMAVLRDKVVPLTSAEECVQAVDALVITTPWPQFKEIPVAAFARAGRRLQVLDCWRMLDRKALAGVADIHYLGIGGAETASRIRAVKS